MSRDSVIPGCPRLTLDHCVCVYTRSSSFGLRSTSLPARPLVSHGVHREWHQRSPRILLRIPGVLTWCLNFRCIPATRVPLPAMHGPARPAPANLSLTRSRTPVQPGHQRFRAKRSRFVRTGPPPWTQSFHSLHQTAIGSKHPCQVARHPYAKNCCMHPVTVIAVGNPRFPAIRQAPGLEADTHKPIRRIRPNSPIGFSIRRPPGPSPSEGMWV